MKPTIPTPKQNAEGEAVAEGQEDESFEEELLSASVNAKKDNPYGPPFPRLYDYFKAQ